MQQHALPELHMVFDKRKRRCNDFKRQWYPVDNLKLQMMLNSPIQIDRREAQYGLNPLFFQGIEIKRIA